MADNQDARDAIRALRDGRTPMEQMGGKDGRPDLQDLVRILSERNEAMKENLMSKAALELRATGPMVTKHFGGNGDVQEFHPGIGGELAATWPNGAGVALGGHYQSQDSNGNPSSWGGVTPFWRFGSQDGPYIEPGLTLGAIQKRGYNDGRVSPLVVPRVGIGIGDIGVNFGVVPPTPGYKHPIATGQIQVRRRF